MTIGREIVDDFEGDVATEDNNGIKWHDSAENCGDGGNVGGVLTDRAIELVLIFAISGNLGPVNAVAVAVNPTKVTFGFKNEDSPFVDGEAIDLQKFGVGNNVIFDVARIGIGVGLRKIAIDEDILGVKDFFKTKN